MTPARSSPARSAPARKSGLALTFGTWTLLVVLITASLFGAYRWKNIVTEQRADALDSIERQTATAASSQLERVISTMLTLRGMVVANPAMTNPQFLEWYRSSDMEQQAPGGLAFTSIQRVPRAELPAFAARQVADPINGQPSGDTFSVLSDDVGPDYCLQRVAIWRVTEVASMTIPAGLDMCSVTFPGYGVSTFLPVLEEATDTGTATVLRDDNLMPTSFGIVLPVYVDAVVPATPELRRAASIGWVAGSFDRNMLVAAASSASSPLAIEVSRANRDGSVTNVASGGATLTAADEQVAIVPLQSQGTWQVKVVGTPETGGRSAATQAIVLLVGGIALSVLLFLFIRVLAGSRNRALELVDRKTGELEYQALHDELTGLPNRALVMDRADQMIARSRRRGSPIAALFIDLDNFKAVNDTLGHSAGDLLLCGVADRLTGALRTSDTVGRLGGDELVVLVEDQSLLGGPEVVAQHLLDVLTEPFDLAGRSTAITASIGIAVGLRDTAEEWLRDADVALYERKAAGKNGFLVFEPDMRTVIERRIALETELRRAVDEQQFHLVYQPSFDLQTNVPTGVEALIRWNHPTRGTVMPDEFIPEVEANGLILPIGRWVLHEACRQGALWREAGHHLLMSVNVSARQLDDEQFVDDVRTTLAATGFEPSSLVLEATETTIMSDNGATQARLLALKALGVRIAIDNFGTGYSSLALLGEFPVDTIKIDRSFISGMAATAEGIALVHTLIQLAATLGLETLAEGIEEDEQLNRLRGQQCDFGQGFLYAKPLEPAALEEFLEIHTTMHVEPVI